MRNKGKSAAFMLAVAVVLAMTTMWLPSAPPAAQGSDAVNGTYSIELLTPDGYVTVGTEEFGKYPQAWELWLPAGHGSEVTLHLTKQADGLGFADSLLVDAVAPAASSTYVEKKLALNDLDVLEITSEGLELHYTGVTTGRITLTALIEPEETDAHPFYLDSQFVDGQYQSVSAVYGMDNFGTMAVDDSPGELDPAAAFVVYETKPTTGHPDGNAWIWLSHDADYLYAALEWGSDNTFDYGEDFFSVIAQTPDGLKEFTQWSDRGDYGQAFFAYTDLLPYQHMCYQMAIPLAELGNTGGPIELGFALYGTAGVSTNVSLSVSGTHTFPAAVVGYAPLTPLTVDAENLDPSWGTYQLDITLSGADAGSFVLDPTSITNIPAGGKESFTVVPDTGLPTGTYTATVTASWATSPTTRLSVGFDVSFTVTPASPKALVGANLEGIEGAVGARTITVTVADTYNEPITLTCDLGGVKKTATRTGNGDVSFDYTAAELNVLPPGWFNIVVSSAATTNNQAIAETIVGTLTINPPPLTLTVIQHFGTWTGSGTATGIIDGPYDKFMNLYLGNSPVGAGNFKVAEGSTVITLLENYLKTLADGSYAFWAEFSGGTIYLDLTVERPVAKPLFPQTGDGASSMGWLAVLLLSAAGLIGVLKWHSRQPGTLI